MRVAVTLALWFGYGDGDVRGIGQGGEKGRGRGNRGNRGNRRERRGRKDSGVSEG